MQSPPDSPEEVSPVVAAVGRGVFAFMLAGFGAAITWFGCKAIRDQHYVLKMSVVRGAFIGPFSFGDSGTFTETLGGAQAVRFGAGLVSAGLLFAVWALGIVAMGPRKPGLRPGPLSVLTFSLVVVAAICFAPPWLVPGNLWIGLYWATVVVWTTAVVRIVRAPVTKRALRVVVPLAAVSFGAEMLLPLRASGPVLLGLVSSLAGLAHFAYLYPPWRRRLLAHGQDDSPKVAALAD